MIGITYITLTNMIGITYTAPTNMIRINPIEK